MDIIVGVADMQASKTTDAVLSTYSLGSCIGIALYDPGVKAGGLLHFMLPDSGLHADRVQTAPYMFADTGIPLLFKAVYALGARKERLKVVVAGGSQTLDPRGFFNIGQKNLQATRCILRRNGIQPDHLDVGGAFSRTLKLSLNRGKVLLKTSGREDRIL